MKQGDLSSKGEKQETKTEQTSSPLKKLKSEMLSEGTTNNKFWWEKDIEMEKEEIKWTQLEHKGVYFPEPYQGKGIKIKYDDKEIKLDDYQEEIAIYWTESLGSEFHSNFYFKKNFSEIFNLTFLNSKHVLGLSEEQQINFDLFDFSNILKFIETKKKKKKELDKEEKKKINLKNQEIANKYKYAIVDNYLEKIGNFRIEPPSLFKGRGAHPQSGKIKSSIKPEDVNLNLSKDAPVPICHLPGRSWGSIISQKENGWLASCYEEVTKSKKYVHLGASSKIKGLKDIKKYEKARKLKNEIESIRENYTKKMKSVSIKERQLGTATYIIDFLAIRAGNEKGEDEADTVGCCSLRKEHIKFNGENEIILDFLGKDSMRYINTVKINPVAYENLKLFCEGKKDKDQIFCEINSGKLNEYLNSLMDGLTAKVFRTFNASYTLDQELFKGKNPLNKKTMEEKLAFYQEANRKVAILCNHQKGITKNMEESLTNQNKKLKEMKKELKTLKKSEPKSPKYNKLKERIRKLEQVLEEKEKNKGIALNTSKINYNDPRITVAWCKANEVSIEKIFTTILLDKFVWAMNVKSDWRF
jgi:DNA topoisomerase-1